MATPCGCSDRSPRAARYYPNPGIDDAIGGLKPAIGKVLSDSLSSPEVGAGLRKAIMPSVIMLGLSVAAAVAIGVAVGRKF